MLNVLIPKALLKIDRAYNRTSFPRGRGACPRIFRWGAKNLGFKSPVLRLKSGIGFEYSPLVVMDVVMRELLTRDVFEPRQTKIILDFMRNKRVFVDVGANMGYFSVLVGKLIGKGGRVFAFEPVDATYKLLSRNIQINDLNDIVTPFKLGCFSKPGEMTMELSYDSGKSRITESKGPNTETVSIVTLDQFLEQQGVSAVDCIKIDAEGVDFEVIKGARQTIEKYRPAVIMESFPLTRTDSSTSELTDFFNRLQYSVSELKGDHSVDLLWLPLKK